MVAGVAGAPGLCAQQAPGKGGENATTLHPRMEVLLVQAGVYRHKLADASEPRLGSMLWRPPPTQLVKTGLVSCLRTYRPMNTYSFIFLKHH